MHLQRSPSFLMLAGLNGVLAQCSNPPCAAALLGEVARTTARGIDAQTGKVFNIGGSVHGPFEARLNSSAQGMLSRLGCAHGQGYVEGGIDTQTAEQSIAQSCNVVLPRLEGSSYISLLDECGSQIDGSHFHERLGCLYANAPTGHSPKVRSTHLLTCGFLSTHC